MALQCNVNSSSLHSALGDIRLHLRKLGTDLGDLSARVDHANERNSASVNEVRAEALDVLTSHRSTVSSLQREVHGLSTRVDAMVDRVDVLAMRVGASSATHDAHAAHIARLEERMAELTDSVERSISVSAAASRKVDNIAHTLREETNIAVRNVELAAERNLRSTEQELRSLHAESSATTATRVDKVYQDVERLSGAVSGAQTTLMQNASRLEADLKAHATDLERLVRDSASRAKEASDTVAQHSEALADAQAAQSTLQREVKLCKEGLLENTATMRRLESEANSSISAMNILRERIIADFAHVERRVAGAEQSAVSWSSAAQSVHTAVEDMRRAIDALGLQQRSLAADLQELNQVADQNFVGVRTHLTEHESVIRAVNEAIGDKDKQFKDFDSAIAAIKGRLKVVDAVVATQNVLQQYQSEALQHQEVLQGHLAELKEWQVARLEQMNTQWSVNLARMETAVTTKIATNRYDIEVVLARLEDPMSYAVFGADLKNIIGKPGVLVIATREGGPAEAASLKVDDQIVSLNGVQIHSLTEFRNTLRLLTPGSVVSVVVVRKGTSATTELHVTLGSAPSAPERRMQSSSATKLRSGTVTRSGRSQRG